MKVVCIDNTTKYGTLTKIKIGGIYEAVEHRDKGLYIIKVDDGIVMLYQSYRFKPLGNNYEVNLL